MNGLLIGEVVDSSLYGHAIFQAVHATRMNKMWLYG